MSKKENPHFIKYINSSEDLNPEINTKRHRLPTKRGAFFFPFLSMQESEEYRKVHGYWLHNFDVILANGRPELPVELLDEIAAYDGVNFFYNALNGFYEYQAYKHILGEYPPIMEFGDPPCTILFDEAGNKMPQEEVDGTWRFDIVENHRNWLINPDNPIGGRSSGEYIGGWYGGRAYYFDFGEDPSGLAEYTAMVFEKFAKKTHYNGAFFDYSSAGYEGSFLPTRVMDLFAEKYNYFLPDGTVDYRRAAESYDKDAGWFLYLLRQKMSRKIHLFANQCFYAYKNYYQAVDHDITESYFVSFAYGRTGRDYWIESRDDQENIERVNISQTFYRGLKGSITDASEEALANTAENTVSMGKDENTIQQIASRALPAIEALNLFNGCPKFYFLDYMIPKLEKTGRFKDGEDIYVKRTDRDAIFYSVACQRLFNCEGSVTDWYGGEGWYDKDDVYFIDLGQTLNKAYLRYKFDGTQVESDMEADYVARFFENGFVIVSGEPVKSTLIYKICDSFIPTDTVGFYDALDKKYYKDTKSITINPNYYPALDGYINPNCHSDIDDGFRPVGKLYVYIRASDL